MLNDAIEKGEKGGLNAVKETGGLAHKKRLDPFDIIKRDIEMFHLDMDPYHTYATLLKMVEQPNYRLMRANDTIVLLSNNGDHTGEGMIFTADKPQMFVKTLRQLYSAFRTAGFVKVSFVSAGIAIEPLLKKSGINYKLQPIKLDMGGKQVDGHHITVME